MKETTMRILVVGAGATGGYFGGRLAEAGRDVTFLVRPARAEQLRSAGLQIISPHGNATLRPTVVTAGNIAAPYEVVVLTVKGFALDAAIADLAPAVGPNTMVLPVLNGMRHIDVLTERFGEQPVLGGVCLVATMLDGEGRVVQLAELQELTYGERNGTASARIAALDAAMQDSGFKARASLTILQEMWEKWVFLATLGGITCLLRGTIGEIEAVPGGADLARQLLAEASAVATAAGYPPSDAFVTRTRTAITTPGSGLASSMYRDLKQGFSVEVDHIIGDLLLRARQLNVPTPLLATAFVHLRLYQNQVVAR
jgi:2-dehydropantoate 2-reductase